jgi:UDP-N-acetylmuramoylalanine--D-glutamate ligase
LGQSGLAAVELLRAQGALVEATDAKPLEQIPEAASRLATLGVGFSPQKDSVFENRDLIVISPGVPADLAPLEEARRRGVRVAGDLELASWFLQGRTIGITGSNGKTTTTALTGHILREAGIPVQVGGNIGRAPAAMVATSRPEQWNVLELSSFQLETIERFHADIAAVLNVTPDHLDRHGTMERYAAAKRRLLETQAPEEPAILNAADPICRQFARLKAHPVWFSSAAPLASGAWLDGGWVVLEGRRLLAVPEVPLRGRHNLENVMAAAAAAHLAGAGHEAIAAAVKSFPGVEHRLEFVRRLRGVDYYNDSKATNVDATLKAIDAFEGPLWVILGGKDKGSDYTPLREPLAAKARAALLIGSAAPKIAAALEGAVPLLECGTLEAAVREAARRASPGDTVLLAPACASFDQFQNFEHRGRTFKALVAALEEKPCA